MKDGAPESDTVMSSEGGGILGMIDRYFKISERKSTIRKELAAGCITFVTLSYILAVNSSMISKTGGTCPEDQRINSECVDEVRKDLLTATAVSAMVGTLVMGLWANLPLGLAPGMGMNAYFTYTVVGFGGKTEKSGTLSYEAALTCVFIEGIIFILLALTGIRLYIAKLIPRPIRFATTVGIGLFLAILGFLPAEGIALVVTDPVTSVTLGGCGHDYLSPEREYEGPNSMMYPAYRCYKWSVPYLVNEESGFKGEFGPTPGDGFYCGCEAPGGNGAKGVMAGPTTWMGILGFMIMIALMYRGVRGAVFFGMLVVFILSIFRGTLFTAFPDNSTGDAKFEQFKEIVGFNKIKHTAFVIFPSDFGEAGQFLLALFTFLYVDILDTTGTLYSMADFANMIDKDTGDFEGSTAAFTADAIGTVVGSLLGTSPVTTYIESGAGILEGGRTGLTAVVIAFWFFISIFFFPIITCFPPWSTGPALIVVGCLMMRNVTKVKWEDFQEAFPAAITIMLMPFTFSIAYGIIGGYLTWIVLYLSNMLFDMIPYCRRTDQPGQPDSLDQQTMEMQQTRDLGSA